MRLGIPIIHFTRLHALLRYNILLHFLFREETKMQSILRWCQAHLSKRIVPGLTIYNNKKIY